MKYTNTNRFSFCEIDYNNINEAEFSSLPKKTILTSKSWIDFVIEDSHVKPLIIRIAEDDKFIGYFTSLVTCKFGIKIIGSPFQGWSTPFMGFDLLETGKETEILPELITYLFKTFSCNYLQLRDRNILMEDAENLCLKYGYFLSAGTTLELGVDYSDEILYKNMKTDCRNFIRQFERRGASIEYAIPDEEFAEEYYEQLLDVFAKQKLVPTYGVKKVKALLSNLSKSDSVLCLRVKDPDGKSIATSIFPGFNNKFFFWGGASLRPFQQYRPNEYMIYTAMRYWRDRGCKEFDMVGVRPYKKKFGSWEVHYPCIEVTNIPLLHPLKNIAAKLFYFKDEIIGRLKGRH